MRKQSRSVVLGWVWGGLGVTALAALPGCARPGSMPPAAMPATGQLSGGPFAPASMRVYPLTQIERTGEGEARLVLHLELRDAWGDTVKGIGNLQVQLLRAGGAGRDERMWEVDMWDPASNALYYDSATRTYRVQLRDLPEWAVAQSERRGGSVRVLAVLRTPAPDGSERFLRDEYVIRD